MKNLLLIILFSLSTLNAINDELEWFFQEEFKEQSPIQSPTQEELREKVLVLIEQFNIKHPKKQCNEMPIIFCIKGLGLFSNPEFTLNDLDKAFNAKKAKLPNKLFNLKELEIMKNFLIYYVYR